MIALTSDDLDAIEIALGKARIIARILERLGEQRGVLIDGEIISWLAGELVDVADAAFKPFLATVTKASA